MIHGKCSFCHFPVVSLELVVRASVSTRIVEKNVPHHICKTVCHYDWNIGVNNWLLVLVIGTNY